MNFSLLGSSEGEAALKTKTSVEHHYNWPYKEVKSSLSNNVKSVYFFCMFEIKVEYICINLLVLDLHFDFMKNITLAQY